MKRKEFFIIASLLFVIAVFYTFQFLTRQNSDHIIIKNIKTDEILLRVPLSEDGFYHVQGEYGRFQIVIKDGKVKAKDVECPNKVCETMGPITLDNYGVNNIICIPNVIEVYLEEK